MRKKDTSESEKVDKSDKSDKALFIQRALAYIIDVFLISLVASLIALPFVDSESITKLQDSYTEAVEKYQNDEINTITFIAESIPLTYQIARKNGFLTIITLFIQILYFIVYQFNNAGQTIGKKLMKIKVVAANDKLTMDQMLVRSVIIDAILLDMIVFALLLVASQNVYFYGTLVLKLIYVGIVIVSIFMVIFSNSGRGLHDLIANTQVIREKN